MSGRQQDVSGTDSRERGSQNKGESNPWFISVTTNIYVSMRILIFQIQLLLLGRSLVFSDLLHFQGCYQAIVDWIAVKSAIFIAVFCIVIVLQVRLNSKPPIFAQASNYDGIAY